VAVDDEVDAVIVLTALDSHHEIGLAFLESEKHVLVEKPLAITIAAGRKLVEAAERTGAVLATAESARFLPECRARHWAIGSRRIGDFRMLVSGMMGHPDWSPDHIVGDTPWRHQKLRGGGGPSIDLGFHRLNQIEYECGPIASISAMAATTEPVRRYRSEAPSDGEIQADAEDTVFASLRFASGTIGTLLLSWGGRGRLVDLPAFAIFGSEGSIHGSQLTNADGDDSDLVGVMRSSANRSTLQSWFPEGISDVFTLEALDWIAAIDARGTGRRPEIDGQAGLRDLAAAFAILESDMTRREVAVEDVLAGAIEAYQRPINQVLGI
jgi:predicted dehydrogenase